MLQLLLMLLYVVVDHGIVEREQARESGRTGQDVKHITWRRQKIETVHDRSVFGIAACILDNTQALRSMVVVVGLTVVVDVVVGGLVDHSQGGK
jgi:hypothetical protein